MKISTIILPATLLASIVSYGQQSEAEEAIRKEQYEKYGKQGEDQLNQYLGSMTNVTPAAEYQFPVSVNQHVITYSNGKVKDEMDMKYYINSEKKTFAMEGSQMGGSSQKKTDAKIVSVYDNSNSAMLMFNLTDKSLFAMNMNAFKGMASQGTSKPPSDKKTEPSDVSCGKTGKTKTILGHSCYEYVCKKADSKSHTALWINDDVKIADMPFMGGGRVPSTYGRSSGIGGGVLEIDAYENDELKTTMTVTEINNSANFSLVTADFKRQQMPTANFGQ